MRQTITLGAAVVFAAALLVATPASADSPAGEFRGVMEDRDRSVPVTLSLVPGPMPGDAAGRIRFGEPWMCGFLLEYSGGQDNAAGYSFRDSGAGPCEPYTRGFVRVTQPAGDILFLELFDGRMDIRQKTFLQRRR